MNCYYEEDGCLLLKHGFGVIDNHDKQLVTQNSSPTTLVDGDDEEQMVSDCESSVSGPAGVQRIPLFESGLSRLVEGDRIHDVIKSRFLLGLGGSIRAQTEVVSIYRNSCSSYVGRAKFHAFQIFSKATEKMRGGNANVRYAWFATKEGDEISRILQHGFDLKSNCLHNHGSGVYLSPDHSPLKCDMGVNVDEHGLRHLLLCRVVLGKQELVPPGSDQCYPSSQEFDSGVDSLTNPTKYIVWSTNMNTHILPEYVVSFRAPSCLKEYTNIEDQLKKPTSPWMPFPALISSISKFLPPRDLKLIYKHYRDHKDKKISRKDLIQRVRKITGDELLITVIKAFRSKQLESPRGFTHGLANEEDRRNNSRV